MVSMAISLTCEGVIGRGGGGGGGGGGLVIESRFSACIWVMESSEVVENASAY